MSHPRLCFRTSWVIVRYLGVLPDRSVHTWSGRVSPYLVSRVATPHNDTGEQARSVYLLETWVLVSRKGSMGLANGQNSSWVAKLTVDKTVPNSVRVLP